jgi:hypothetical protein
MAGEAQGQQGLYDDTSPFNATSFLISQALAQIAGSTLVQVKAVTTHGEADLVGTVDVLPLVNMVDGAGRSMPHEVVYGLPYSRVQGGLSAVICDPCVGDIGVAVFASRDISSVKKSKAQANPGTFLQNSMSSGLYLFTVLTAHAPTNYVRFVLDGDGAPTGIEIVDVNTNKVTLDSTGVKIQDLSGNTIAMDTNGVTINGVKFDRSQNVSGAKDLTTTGTASLGGGGQFVKLADGSNATKVKGT